MEKSDTNGQTYMVQYFERAVFELHPENPKPNDVLLSLLGVFQYKQKYQGGSNGSGGSGGGNPSPRLNRSPTCSGPLRGYPCRAESHSQPDVWQGRHCLCHNGHRIHYLERKLDAITPARQVR